MKWKARGLVFGSGVSFLLWVFLRDLPVGAPGQHEGLAVWVGGFLVLAGLPTSVVLIVALQQLKLAAGASIFLILPLNWLLLGTLIDRQIKKEDE